MEPLKTGVYVPYDPVTDSGRYSTAETVMTRDSQATFAPPYAGVEPSDRNLPFQKPTVFEENAPTKILSEDALDLEDFDGWRRRRKRRRIAFVILFVAFIAIVGAAGFLLGAGTGDDENQGENNAPPPLVTNAPTLEPTNNPTTSPTAKPTKNPTPNPTGQPTDKPTVQPTSSPTTGSFCAPFGVTDDSMRQLLRDGFDAALNAPFNEGRVFYTSSQLVCLPSNAWALLDANQRSAMINLSDGIRIATNQLRSIHPNAFDPTLVANHVTCNLAGNRLQSLPDFLFRDFVSMRSLVLGNNEFITLNNNLFDPINGSPSLRTLAINTERGMVSFPETMLFTPNLFDLQMQDSDGLINFNPEAFANVNLGIIRLTSSTPLVDDPGIAQMASVLGINVNVFQVRINTPTLSPTPQPTPQVSDFCASLGVTDDQMREILASDFDAALGSNLFYTNREIICLPKDAWGFLSATQRSILVDLVGGIRIQTGLRLIHPDAFDAELVQNHLTLNLNENDLTELPDFVFKDFVSMTSLVLSGNEFVTISNNIFDPNVGSESLLTLSMNQCRELVNFPEVMLFTQNLRDLQFQNSNALVEFNEEAFETVDRFNPGFIIRLSLSTPVVTEPGVEFMADALGISVERIDVR